MGVGEWAVKERDGRRKRGMKEEGRKERKEGQEEGETRRGGSSMRGLKE